MQFSSYLLHCKTQSSPYATCHQDLPVRVFRSVALHFHCWLAGVIDRLREFYDHQASANQKGTFLTHIDPYDVRKGKESIKDTFGGSGQCGKVNRKQEHDENIAAKNIILHQVCWLYVSG